MARTPTSAPPRTVRADRLRRLALDAQGLAKKAGFGRGKNGVRRAIETIGYVQIDTISVVARAHDHVLHSRVPNYDPVHLDRLQAEGSIFEYWYHAAAYLPMRDYRFARQRMDGMRDFSDPWVRCRDEKLMRKVLARVRAEGPLKARDFEAPPGEQGGWWNWKPAKRALEQLFMQGDLMVVGRDGFQKTYDLTERVLPSGIDTRAPDQREMANYLLDTMLRAHGFITPRTVTHLRRGKPIRLALKTALEERQAERTLIAIRQACDTVAYVDPERLESRTTSAQPRALLLSPFDNLVIHRNRVRSVFEFDYQIECYLKEKDRQYGYFCLPIVYRDRIVGRADCKAHRKDGLFEIKHLHLEDKGKPLDDGFLPALVDAVRRFAAFNGCSEIGLRRTSPRSFAAKVRDAINS